MRRWPALAFLLSAGCSTAPIADLMDHYYPSDANSRIVARVVVPPPSPAPRPPMPRLPLGALPIVEPPAAPVPSAIVPDPPPPPPPPVEPAVKPVIEPVARKVVAPAVKPPPQPGPAAPSGVVPAIFRFKNEARDGLPGSLPADLSLPR